jgi:hypothetical protein
MAAPEDRFSKLKAWPARAMRLSVLIGCILSGVSRPAFPQSVTKEQLEAAFIYNFAKFVQWPDQAFSTASDPLKICALGPSGVADALMAGVKDRRVAGRAVAVDIVSTPAEAEKCQVLFVSSRKQVQWGEMTGELHRAPVLTVGEVPEFTRDGGIITLALVSQQLRFVINNAAARRAGLKISSQLLSLAVRVED